MKTSGIASIIDSGGIMWTLVFSFMAGEKKSKEINL
jgi:hypothetical protein